MGRCNRPGGIANQLTADMDAEFDRIIDYSYDEAGNILQKKVSVWDGNVSNVVRGTQISKDTYSYTDSTWKDLLTSYNGQTITYDAIGNPLNYRDGITLTWQNGRKLASFSNNNYDITYTYDASGMRTTKSIDVLGDIKYVYEGSLLLRMDYLGTILDFSYDANGTPIGFRYNDDGAISYYYYGVNSRGDIISIYNVAGAEVIQYSYDAYGKPLSTSIVSGYASIATINPLRYRGYVYDKETGLYYLQSRYYDPVTCRFVNEDIYCDTGIDFNGFNMFVYCNNNPIMFSDPSGELTTYSGVTYSGVEFHNIPAHQLGWYGQIKDYWIDSVAYDVPMYYQGELELCWAFCQTMVEDYNAGIISSQESATQRAIDLAYKCGRNPYGTYEEASWWPTNCLSYYDSGIPVFESGIYNVDKLAARLAQKGPIYAYYLDSNNKLAYLVLITGVDVNNAIIHTNNPNYGYGKQVYSQFYTGYAGGPQDGSFRFYGYILYK